MLVLVSTLIGHVIVPASARVAVKRAKECLRSSSDSPLPTLPTCRVQRLGVTRDALATSDKIILYAHHGWTLEPVERCTGMLTSRSTSRRHLLECTAKAAQGEAVPTRITSDTERLAVLRSRAGLARRTWLQGSSVLGSWREAEKMTGRHREDGRPRGADRKYSAHRPHLEHRSTKGVAMLDAPEHRLPPKCLAAPLGVPSPARCAGGRTASPLKLKLRSRARRSGPGRSKPLRLTSHRQPAPIGFQPIPLRSPDRNGRCHG